MTAWTRPLADAEAAVASVWQRAPHRSPFQHPALARAVVEVFGLDAQVVGVGEESAPDAVLIAFEKTRGPVRALALPPHLPVSAPLLATRPDTAKVHARQTALDALIQALSERYAQATLRLPVGWLDARPFAWAGWRVETTYTFVATLDPDREPTADWSRRVRRKVRAEASAWTVETGAEAIPDVARAQLGSLDAKSVRPPADAAQLERLMRALDTAGLLRAYRVRDADGEVQGAGAFTQDRDQAVFWIAGSDPGPAMMTLLAHAFEDLADRGIRHLDLGGANVPTVAEFKRRLGGTLTPQLQVRHVGPRWLRLLHALRLR